MIHSEDGATAHSHPHYDTFRPTPAPIERYLASRYHRISPHLYYAWLCALQIYVFIEM